MPYSLPASGLGWTHGLPCVDIRSGAISMSLYKRGGVYWSYIWINNVRHGRSLKTGNKQEAIRREIDFRNELDITRHKKSNLEPEMRFAELATRFAGSSAVKPYHRERIE